MPNAFSLARHPPRVYGSTVSLTTRASHGPRARFIDHASVPFITRHMDSLFPIDPASSPPVARGSVVRVALERGIDKQLDYAVPDPLQSLVHVGQRVRVPLGRSNKPAFGVVVDLPTSGTFAKLKPLDRLVDDRTLFSPELLEIALWISRYYLCPLGVVMEAMIPSAVKKRIGAARERVVRPNRSREELQSIFESIKAPKRRAILARILQVPDEEAIEVHRLAGEAGVKAPAVLGLVKRGLLKLEHRYTAFDHSPYSEAPHVAPPPPQATADQQRVIAAITPHLAAGFSVHLLRGVTGSGKTEVYLRLIERVIASGLGALVMVPEIALTPQTARRFTERFGKVAVMHSGLSAGERYRQWQSVAAGEADVIVGARSSIFAPHPRLGLIVVDEEHEPSYKQDSAPRYHARDLAIKRAHQQKIPVLLGSATPSLESWQRATDASLPDAARYHLHELPARVSDRPLPTVEIVDLREANRLRKGIHLFSPRLEAALKQTLDRNQQAILLLNRRGYSNFIYCASCQSAIQCKFCDKTLTYHRAAELAPQANTPHPSSAAVHTGQAHCHYCLAVNPLPPACPTCGKRLTLFGLGTQRVEEEMSRKFPGVPFARVDSDTMRNASDYEKLLARFASGELRVLLGTQMLAKGLDFPNVTLVGVINGDTALSLPDFRAAERTFQLLTQVAGRAGRGSIPGRVIVQTFLPDDPTIQAAVSQDFVRFASAELEQRKAVQLPPFVRQARIVVRDEEPEALAARAEHLAADIRQAIDLMQLPVRFRGPIPAPVGRIAGYYRQQLLISAASASTVQKLLAELRAHKHVVSGDRVAIDVDPISLL